MHTEKCTLQVPSVAFASTLWVSCCTFPRHLLIISQASIISELHIHHFQELQNCLHFIIHSKKIEIQAQKIRREHFKVVG
jgi:ribosomal protein S26